MKGWQPWSRMQQLLQLTQTEAIVRRYFVVNGFDGALTMLGILAGAWASGRDDPQLVLAAGVGAAVALGMSGISSAYISEVAERRKALAELEQAMARDLSQSAHGRAARWVPWLVGAVNGLAPLVICLLILLPLLLSTHLPDGSFLQVSGLSPLVASMLLALAVIFVLGMFLSRVSGTRWLSGGLKSLLLGLVTLGVILLLGG